MHIRRLFFMIIVVISVLSGCSLRYLDKDSLTPLPEEVRLQLKRIVVFPSTVVPETRFSPFTQKGEGSGAAAGALSGLGKFRGVSGPGAILVIPFIPIAMGLGAGEGVENAVPNEMVQKIDGLLKNAALNANIQIKFADNLATTIENELGQLVEREGLRKTGSSSERRDDMSSNIFIEVAISDFGFFGGWGKDPDTSLFVTARAETIAQDGTRAASGAVTCLGANQHASAWLKDGDARIQNELVGMYECLSGKIVFTLFREQPLARGLEEANLSDGLRQYYPRSLQGPSQPLFQWEAFPRPIDKAKDTGGFLSKIGDVTYDIEIKSFCGFLDQKLCNNYKKEAVRVQEVVAEAPPPPISIDYLGRPEAQAIRSPLEHAAPDQKEGTVRIAEYVLDETLSPQTAYSWKVRARFRINGQERFTPWSGSANFISPEFKLPRKTGNDPADLHGGRSPSLALFNAARKTYSRKTEVQGKTFYTAVNLWFDESGKITTTNYHDGTLLPLGRKVTVEKVFDDFIMGHKIRFSDSHAKTYTLELTRHVAEGITIWDIFGRCFFEQEPTGSEGVLGALKPEEKADIDSGIVKTGMTKAAVLMTYGYPPSHRTPDLEANKWIYWTSRDTGRNQLDVFFVDDIVKHVQP